MEREAPGAGAERFGAFAVVLGRSFAGRTGGGKVGAQIGRRRGDAGRFLCSRAEFCEELIGGREFLVFGSRL